MSLVQRGNPCPGGATGLYWTHAALSGQWSMAAGPFPLPICKGKSFSINARFHLSQRCVWISACGTEESRRAVDGRRTMHLNFAAPSVEVDLTSGVSPWHHDGFFLCVDLMICYDHSPHLIMQRLNLWNDTNWSLRMMWCEQNMKQMKTTL